MHCVNSTGSWKKKSEYLKQIFVEYLLRMVPLSPNEISLDSVHLPEIKNPYHYFTNRSWERNLYRVRGNKPHECWGNWPSSLLPFCLLSHSPPPPLSTIPVLLSLSKLITTEIPANRMAAWLERNMRKDAGLGRVTARRRGEGTSQIATVQMELKHEFRIRFISLIIWYRFSFLQILYR